MRHHGGGRGGRRPLIHGSGRAAFEHVFAVPGMGDAQRLYQRLGFAVIGERCSTLTNAQGQVPDHRCMQWQALA
ncbi:MAG TPA: hypothetical protein VIO59_02050 [Rhodanobacter sp.]